MQAWISLHHTSVVEYKFKLYSPQKNFSILRFFFHCTWDLVTYSESRKFLDLRKTPTTKGRYQIEQWYHFACISKSTYEESSVRYHYIREF